MNVKAIVQFMLMVPAVMILAPGLLIPLATNSKAWLAVLFIYIAIKVREDFKSKNR